MALLLILTPIAGSLTLVIPPYLGILSSLYLIYQPQDGTVNPVLASKYHIREMVDLYLAHLTHWAGQDSLQAMQGAMLIIPPFLGMLIGFYLFYRLALYCWNVYQL